MTEDEAHRATTAEAVLQMIDNFIIEQEITCAETIYQCDRVILAAHEFIERLCDAAGYVDRAA